jgi:hypothetical protein
MYIQSGNCKMIERLLERLAKSRKSNVMTTDIRFIATLFSTLYLPLVEAIKSVLKELCGMSLLKP